jgi:hypothetical protein
MDRAAAFLLRRVVLGVIVGLTVLAVGFFGWVQFRTSEYHEREARMLSHYRHDYAACVREQVDPAGCAQQLRRLCTRDAFWQREQPPFLIDLAPQFSTPEARCTVSLAG